MISLTEVDVVIVGAGPAGVSTALHLVHESPDWAQRIVVVDKAIHPRDKLCGGGITRWGEQILERIGHPLEIRSVSVREAQIVYEDLVIPLRGEPVFRVVRRAEFDHWLVRRAEACGVLVRQGETVSGVEVTSRLVRVTTDKGEIRARALVAADGSLSTVRRRLNWNDAPNDGTRSARLIEVDTPEEPVGSPAFEDGIARFDFSYATGHLQGYCWDFPSYVEERPIMNRGLFDSRVVEKRPRAGLRSIMRTALLARSRELDDYVVKGHPIRRYHTKADLARPRVILVGDAAGVDPVFGEGISFALAYGEIAAAALSDAFSRSDFDFLDYGDRVRAHWLTGQLRWRSLVARLAYLFNRRRFYRIVWRIGSRFVRIVGWDKAEPPEQSDGANDAATLRPQGR